MKNFGRRLKTAARLRLNAMLSDTSSITRTIHIVWVGDQSKRPDRWINSWRHKNPGWTVRVWGNSELTSLEWINHKHISEMLNRQAWEGVADMMRWEILDKHGGFAVDADSLCVRTLENWLFEPQIFAGWENELRRPGLIANGYVYARPGNPLVREIISDIYDLEHVPGPAYLMVGPYRLTDTFRRMKYTDLTIYPSHYFIPTHHTGLKYQGSGPVFAQQMWSNTRQRFEERAKAQAAQDAEASPPEG